LPAPLSAARHLPFTEFHTVCFGSASTRVENPEIRLAAGCGDRVALLPCASKNEAPLKVRFECDVSRQQRHEGDTNLATARASNITAPTRFIAVKDERYAYRQFGAGSGLPLLYLQHFTGTLDNWDPAVTDPLAEGREVILFESAGIGRSSGKVPQTIAGMAAHALAFLDALGLKACDVLGYSLGGMVAQQMAQDRPSIFRRIILVGTAPRGGEDIMHLEKPSLKKHLGDPKLQGYAVLQKIFFAPTQASQAAGAGFIERLVQRKEDREPASGAEIAQAQRAAFREWDRFGGERFADLKNIRQPALVVNGIHDDMIPVRNSYWLSAALRNAVLLTYPDSGHGSLFQFHESFTRQAAAFLASNSDAAPY
jgi:pimeloyl-ACP methyl ester carboxylesterase